MKILMQRGDRIFLVEQTGTYYLVNLDRKQATKANPPDSPDMFLKLGYFEDVDSILLEEKDQVIDILKAHLKANIN